VKLVFVSLRRELTATRCAHWNGKAWVNRACSRPIWLKPAGLGRWQLTFPAQTTPGDYVVSTYAVDKAGNKQTKLADGKSAREFTIGE
jgi:hypothetical protein